MSLLILLEDIWIFHSSKFIAESCIFFSTVQYYYFLIVQDFSFWHWFMVPVHNSTASISWNQYSHSGVTWLPKVPLVMMLSMHIWIIHLQKLISPTGCPVWTNVKANLPQTLGNICFPLLLICRWLQFTECWKLCK